MAYDLNGNPVPIAVEPSIVDQVVDFTASVASTAFTPSTRFISIMSDADFHFKVGETPAATVGNKKRLAGQVEYFAVTAGHKIAAINAI